jgi:hypothetical protein
MCSFNSTQRTRQETGIISWHISVILSLVYSTDLRGNESFKKVLELFSVSRKTKEMKNTRNLEAYLALVHEGLVVLCPAASCWFRLDFKPVCVEFLFKKITLWEVCLRTLLFSLVRIIPSMSLINVTLICHQCYISGSVVKGHTPSSLRLNDYSYIHTHTHTHMYIYIYIYVCVCVCVCVVTMHNLDLRSTVSK